MNRNRKSAWRYGVFFLLALVIFFALIPFAACASVGNEPSDERGNMEVDFGDGGMIRNGTEYRTYQVEEGEKGIVSIRIFKDSGRIDIDVYRAGNKDNPDYTGRNLDSAEFEVIVSEPGEYKVLVTAKKFVGDYSISWRIE